MATCSKVPYASYEVARRSLVIVRAKSAGRRARLPVAIHPCATCGLWHLTSKATSGKPWWIRRYGDPLVT
jgi:hypothetical protein